MSKAIEKIRESRYFINQMRACKGSIEFKYNLSAFLSAARSVTFYLQKQNRGKDGFDEWYSKKQEEMSGSILFKVMKNKRNEVVKEGYPEITAKFYGEKQNPGGTSSSSIELEMTRSEIIDEKEVLEIIDFDEFEHRYTLHLPDEDDKTVSEKSLCDVCEDYLISLESIVKEWN